MILRAIIVLPIYLAVYFFGSRLAAFERFADVVRAHGAEHLSLHLWGYGIAIAVSLGVAGATHDLSYDHRVGAAVRVLRMTMLGVAATSAYQLFLYFTGEELSVVILLLPLAFAIAEISYELVAYALDLWDGREPTRRQTEAVQIPRLDRHPSSYYAAQLATSQKHLQPEDRRPHGRHITTAIGSGATSFDLFLPADGDKPAEAAMTRAHAVLSQIIELDRTAREARSARADDYLEFVSLMGDDIVFAYLERGTWRGWEARFKQNAEGAVALASTSETET